MKATITKSESITEFLARGGQIKRVPMNMGKRGYGKFSAGPKKEEVVLENIDMSVLPEALKIKYGIK